MAKLANYTVIGRSGQAHIFEVYPMDATWNEVAAVFLITKRTLKQDGTGTHTNLYVGETASLKEMVSKLKDFDCFAQNGANCICVLQESSKDRRVLIVHDIVGKGTWTCNSQANVLEDKQA